MDTAKLDLIMHAHRIGVEDARLALQLAISKSGKFTAMQQAEILLMAETLVVFPTRAVKELGSK